MAQPDRIDGPLGAAGIEDHLRQVGIVAVLQHRVEVEALLQRRGRQDVGQRPDPACEIGEVGPGDVDEREIERRLRSGSRCGGVRGESLQGFDEQRRQ
jgi:hypothetical protein